MASKVNILVQEGSRRIRNCSPDLPWDRVVPHLNKLMISMHWGGYKEGTKRLVAVRILARYASNIENLKSMGRPLYRDKESRRLVVREDKSSWLRASGATATMMVPTTAGSRLAKGLPRLKDR